MHFAYPAIGTLNTIGVIASLTPPPMEQLIPVANEDTSVLLVHSPYPGKLKFDALPSSLLHAIAPFAASAPAGGSSELLGYLDPGTPSPAFYARLKHLARAGGLRAVCICTSTAAIEETARVVEVLRDGAGHELLIAVGGPHEDDCNRKVAATLDGVDLSIAGDGEYVLGWVLGEHLMHDGSPEGTCRKLEQGLDTILDAGHGRGTVTSPWWCVPKTRPFDFGLVSANESPPCPQIDKAIRFPVFRSAATIPLLVSRGCPYGQCTFCAEGARGRGQLARSDFRWLEELLHQSSGVALYFQDSIFPNNEGVREGLLPLLREWGGEWGCQVYLRSMSHSFLRLLAEAGCSYIYTGIETASGEILSAIGKPNLTRELAVERLAWIRDEGVSVGLSLMFGSLALDGRLLETEATVAETVALAEQIRGLGVDVAGFYPNVQTILPGTALARGLQRAGHKIDFYSVPRCSAFDCLEDGSIGYNFMTLPSLGERRKRESVAERVVEASIEVQQIGTVRWDPKVTPASDSLELETV